MAITEGCKKREGGTAIGKTISLDESGQDASPGGVEKGFELKVFKGLRGVNLLIGLDAWRGIRIICLAGWSSPVAREAHNLEVVGSNPAPATELRVSNSV